MRKTMHTPITREQLSAAYRTVLLVANEPQKAQMFAKISAKQPGLAITVSDISDDGVSEPVCKHVRDIFLILYLSCVEAGDKLPLVTRFDVDRAFQRIKALHDYLAKEPDKKMWDKVVDSHPEKEFWTFIRARLIELGIRGNSLKDGVVILTMEAVVEALTDARKKAAGIT